jgi:hypothetical protein
MLLGIDKEAYLGVILQRAANGRFRLPTGERPSAFFQRVDPTPGVPGMNRAVRMPGYPKGSIFMLDGLMANTPGLPVAAQLNGMSAFQNRLAPPPVPDPPDPGALRRGAGVFRRAGCGNCHAGRYFTDNRVLPQTAVGTQPSRAIALAAFPRLFAPPRTYPADTPVPLPAHRVAIPVPLGITPPATRQLAYAQGDPAGGYKVPSLIGLAVTAPYLHDGGVAVAADAIRLVDGRFTAVGVDGLGLPGTWTRSVPADPAASLRALLDRRLRAAVVEANRASPSSSGPTWTVAATASGSIRKPATRSRTRPTSCSSCSAWTMIRRCCRSEGLQRRSGVNLERALSRAEGQARPLPPKIHSADRL